MAFFRNGSEISMPLLIPSNSPLNAKEVADSVAQVLSDLPVDERYVGMAIFCEAENEVYRFTKHDDGNGGLTSGVEDSDFRVDTMSVNTDTLIKVVGTLATPTATDLGKYVLLSTNNIIYKCMLDIDGVTYKWVNVTKKGVEIVNNYTLLPTVTEDTICYVVNDYTDTAVSPNITHKSGFYLWYDDGVNPTEWKPVVSNNNTYFTTTSPVTNKIGQFELDEEYTEADKVTINEVLNRLLHVNIEPEIVFELVGNDTLLEIGQIIPIVNLRLAFTKVGNGNITNIQFYKNGVELGSSQTFIDGITEYTNNTDRSISSDTTYKVIVTYNFGKGDKTLEKEINVKFVKRSFYGTTQDESFVLNSDNIRTLSGSKLGIKKSDKINININSGDVQVIIAYPKEIGDINSIKYIEGMNAEIKDVFTKQIIQVKDLGTTLTDYNVYVYKPINPYLRNATYVATI